MREACCSSFLFRWSVAEIAEPALLDGMARIVPVNKVVKQALRAHGDAVLLQEADDYFQKLDKLD